MPKEGPPKKGGEAAQLMYMLQRIQYEWGKNGYSNVSTTMSMEWATKRWPKGKPASAVYYYQEKMLAYLRDKHSLRSAGRLLRLLAHGNPFSLADYFEQQMAGGGGSTMHSAGDDGVSDDESDYEGDEEFAGFDAIDLATFEVGRETMNRVIGMLPPGFAHLVGKKAPRGEVGPVAGHEHQEPQASEWAGRLRKRARRT